MDDEALDTSPIADGVAVAGRSPHDPRPDSGRRIWFSVYVAGVVSCCLSLLYSLSVPGMVFWPFFVVIWPLVICGVIWVVLALTCAFGKQQARRRRAGVVVSVTASVVAATALLVMLDVPLRARFAVSQGDFAAIARQFDEQGERFDARALNGKRVGTFSITIADVRSGDLVMYESNGAFFDDAGFVYAPDGRLPPSDGSFESPSYTSLGGGWYSFVASW